MALHSRPRPTRAQGQLLINAETGQVKYRDWTCPVIRLTGSYRTVARLERRL